MRLACAALLLLAACKIERYDAAAARDSVVVAESLRARQPSPALPPTAPSSSETTRVAPPPVAADSSTVAPSGLLIPVQGIEPHDLVDTFTDARSQNREHDAIDILAPRGTPVVAATSGRVLRLFTSDRGGLTVYQMGPDERTVYYYAHLDAYAPGLAAGQLLKRGQVLGTVGDTGNAAPGNTHLHFAIWTVEDPKNFWDGVNINPYPLLR